MWLVHPVGKAFVWIALALLMTGCAREDGSKIIGQWRAERFQVMSLKVPIGPELTISRDMIRAGADVAVPIDAISQDGSEITLDLPLYFGLTFNLVDDDRMYVDLPLIERIYYRRVSVPVAPIVAAAPHHSAPAPAPVPAPKPVAVPVPDPVSAPVAASVYSSALAAARSGDHDSAVRLLHRAFEEEGIRSADVQGASEWSALRDDVRFQVLVARYGDR